MTFMARTKAAVFQSPFGAKAITFGHEPLRGDSWKLRQSVQILECIGECVRTSFLKKMPQPESRFWAASRRDSRLFPLARNSSATV